jgi:hypothetical protein
MFSLADLRNRPATLGRYHEAPGRGEGFTPLAPFRLGGQAAQRGQEVSPCVALSPIQE